MCTFNMYINTYIEIYAEISICYVKRKHQLRIISVFLKDISIKMFF